VVAAILESVAKIPPVEQILSAGAAAHAMLLAARALGFNGMWKTGGAAYDDAVKAALGLQSKDAIVGFVYLGTEDRSAQPAQPAARPDWQQFVRYWARPVG